MTADFPAILNKASSGLILLAAHERPDGDAVGSLTALTSILNDNGFSAKAVLPGPVPDYAIPFLPKELIVSSANGLTASLFIILDTSNRKRAAVADFPLESVPDVLNIDHHPDNERFGTAQILDPKACSASQIVYRLVRKAGFRITSENASRLLLGIMTDTGCFRFDNTDPEALRSAADLIALGADHHKLILEVYSSKPENMLRFEAEAVQTRLKTAFNGRFAWISLDSALMEKYGIDPRNMEQVIDLPRNIAGVFLAATLRPEKNGFKLSLRSKDPRYSAGRIARLLNGGGHELAAGGFIPASSLEEAEAILLHHVKMELDSNEKQSQ